MVRLAKNLYRYEPDMRFCEECGAGLWRLMRGYWTCRRGHHFAE